VDSLQHRRPRRPAGESVDRFILGLLELQASRFGAFQVLTLLESSAIRERFNLSESDLELIHRWVRETRIRWGIDSESRGKLGLPEFPENTWRAGIERMLLGYAMPDQEEQMSWEFSLTTASREATPRSWKFPGVLRARLLLG